MIITKRILSLSVLFGILASAAVAAPPESTGQTVQIEQETEIPGASLKPGTYTFSVEDRLVDRAIVRISGPDNVNTLLLAVPSSKLSGKPGHGVVLFPAAKGEAAVLRGWICPACATALEFVYPKLEAVKITDETAVPVLAVDPAYDKLPENLSPEDKKVVTLWLLSPQKITSDHKGVGVQAAKYKAANNGTLTASASRHHLPKTASNTFALGIIGLILLSGAVCLRIRHA